MVVHLLCVIFPCIIGWAAKPGTSLFSFHPTLMAVAYVCLMAEAILVFSRHSSLVLQTTRKAQIGRLSAVRWHWRLNLASLTCSALGFAAIFVNKERNEYPHFTSWHGLIGLTSVGYTAMQCAAGVVQLYPGSVRKFVSLKLLRVMHALSGLFMFLCGTAALMTGLNSSWAAGQFGVPFWYFVSAIPLILCGVVTLQIMQNRGFVSKNT